MRNAIKTRAISITISLSLVLFACGSTAPSATPPPLPPLVTEAQRSIELWTEQRPATYSITMVYLRESDSRRSIRLSDCGAYPDVLTVVEDQTAIFISDDFDACEYNPAKAAGRPLTVSDLFDIAFSKTDTISVDYDPTFGFPRSIEDTYLGETIDITVTSFEPANSEKARILQWTEAVDKQQAIWASQGISSYTMTVEISCFCDAGQVHVRVVDGEVVEMSAHRPEWERLGYLTIEGLFNRVRNGANHYQFNVTYDALGYPAGFYSDDEEHTSDDEISIEVTNLSPSR